MIDGYKILEEYMEEVLPVDAFSFEEYENIYKFNNLHFPKIEEMNKHIDLYLDRIAYLISSKLIRFNEYQKKKGVDCRIEFDNMSNFLPIPEGLPLPKDFLDFYKGYKIYVLYYNGEQTEFYNCINKFSSEYVFRNVQYIRKSLNDIYYESDDSKNVLEQAKKESEELNNQNSFGFDINFSLSKTDIAVSSQNFIPNIIYCDILNSLDAIIKNNIEERVIKCLNNYYNIEDTIKGNNTFWSHIKQYYNIDVLTMYK